MGHVNQRRSDGQWVKVIDVRQSDKSVKIHNICRA